VFEILSGLELPGFDRRNWRSKIRHHVKIHEDYHDLEKWNDDDVDIVYDDKEGVLTQLLVGSGYLDKNIWIGARPKYWLEVKSTTKKCGTRFFLTNPEHEKVWKAD
jgi:hypothetical protein